MIEAHITVVNALGLHARAAAKFVNLAKTFSSTVEVRAGDKSVDGKSIMGVMMLAAEHGSEVVVEAEGSDAEAALEAVTGLLGGDFEST